MFHPVHYKHYPSSMPSLKSIPGERSTDLVLTVLAAMLQHPFSSSRNAITRCFLFGLVLFAGSSEVHMRTGFCLTNCCHICSYWSLLIGNTYRTESNRINRCETDSMVRAVPLTFLFDVPQWLVLYIIQQEPSRNSTGSVLELLHLRSNESYIDCKVSVLRWLENQFCSFT